MPPAVASSGALPPIKSPVSSPTSKEQAAEAKSNQIHNYHKLFWRLNVTLEFNIFYHADRHLYEVAAYHSEKDQEYEPLFLNEEPIKNLIMGNDALNCEIEKLKLKLSKDRFAQKPSPDKLTEMAKIAIFNKFIESHLNPKADNTLTLTGLPGEGIDLEAIIHTPPPVEDEVAEEEETETTPDTAEEEKVVVKDVAKKPAKVVGKTTVVRRQRSSIHEFNKSLSILKKDSNSLKMANRMTENLLKLSEKSVDAFKDALKFNSGSSSRYDKSTPLGMFRWAVHRVVLQRYVEAVRVRLETPKSATPTMRINGTFPAPGSTDMHGQQAKILSLAGRFNANAQMQSLSETLSRENTPRGKAKSKAKANVINHTVSLPQL